MYSSTTTKLPNGKIPIIHKEIQPVVHQEIQPVITKEIQPVIHKYIQPVIFPEKLSIEEVIQQLQQLKKSHNGAIIRFGEPTNGKDEYQHFIQKVEQHTTKREVVPSTKTVTQTIKQYEFVPYIQYSNGNIVPFANNSINSINNNSQMMDTIIAIIFRSISFDINYPIACKKTDIFANVEYKLYKEFPILKSKNIYFFANGNTINKSLTFEQNRIKSGDTIMIEENILNK
jgi:hypothetical protein